jgi:hypothetical protein
LTNKAQTLGPLFRDVLCVLLLLELSLPAFAQGPTTLGTSVNLTGGASNRVQNPSISAPQGSSLSTQFYALYPSLTLNSTRPTSSLSANYAFGYNETVGSSALPRMSHQASLNFNSQLSSRWAAKMSDSFRMTDGLGSFNALSGAPQQASSTGFLFQSVGTRRQPRTNDAAASLDWALDQNSGLSFGVKHSFRAYGGGTTSSLISDQQQLAGSVAYQQKLGLTESWGLSWNATYFDYGPQESITQSGQADYSVGLGRYYLAQIGAGVSRTNLRGTPGGKFTYDAIMGITRTSPSQTFSLAFTQNSTDRIGLGSTAITRRGTLDWRRPLGKATASASISAYKSEGTLSNTLNVRGVTGDVSLGFQLSTRLSVTASGNFRNTRTGSFGFSQRRAFFSSGISYALTSTVFVSGGGTFDKSKQTSQFDFEQRRAYISLRYANPTFHIFR